MFGFGGARGFQLGVVLEAKNLLKGEMRRVKADTDEAKAKLAGLQGQLQRLERYGRMMKIGAGVTAFGVAASAATVKLVDANNRIAESTGKLGTIMAPTYAEWVGMQDEVREKLEDLTVEYVGSYDQMREAAYELKSAGLTEEQMWAGAPHAIEAALATEGEYRETAKTMGMITNNFRKDLAALDTEAERFGHIGDIMGIATREFAITGPSIAQGFAYATGPAKEWGMSLEETTATLGALNTAGLEGGMAGTALMATHRNLLKAEKDLGIQIKKNADGSYSYVNVLDAIAEKYGENIQENDELKKKLQETFGDEGKKAIVYLLDQRDRIREVTKAMREEKGVAREMMRAVNETDAAKVERLGDSWKVFTSSLMKDSDVVDWAVDSLTDLVGALDDMPDWAKELVAGGMAVGGVAGSIGGPLMTGYGALMQYRMAKGIKGLAGAGGLGATRVFETNPAALEAGGIGGKAGAAGAAGAVGKKGIGVRILEIAPWVTLGIYAMTAKPGEGILMSKEEKGALAKGKEAREKYTTKEGKTDWERIIAESPSGGKVPKRYSWFKDPSALGTPKEVSKTENVTVNINTVNTKAADGATLANELKAQARRTGKKKSP
ncbi:MAG TPA: phage tail tape measure protein [bacterium]|nr:phage tail tape measure protein [bacterium]